ncbi:MAG: type IX secretion system sortase PorU [Bacteroidia bacterium]
MRFWLCLCLFLIVGNCAFAQTRNTHHINISWNSPIQSNTEEKESTQLLNFNTAQYSYYDGFLPRYSQNITINGDEKAIIGTITNASYKELTDVEVKMIRYPLKIESEVKIQATIFYHKKQASGFISFIPIRKNSATGKYEKLLSLDILITPSYAINKNESIAARKIYKANSVLQNGNWFKIAVTADGIYKIPYAMLKKMGVKVDSINAKNIRIYGNGGGMLPRANSKPRIDDLEQMAIYVEGENDGVFNTTDYVLFYGQGSTRWVYDSASCPNYKHITDLYSDSTYYFLTTDLGIGKRIQLQNSSSLPVTTDVTGFDDYALHESDNINLIKSGSQWFGEYFANTTSYDFSFLFPYIDLTKPAVINTALAAQYYSFSPSYYSVTTPSGTNTFSVKGVSTSDYDYAATGASCFSFTPNDATIKVTVEKTTPKAFAWLDYIEVNARRKLTMDGNQMLFRDAESTGNGKVARFNLTAGSIIQLWDVTDPTNVYLQALTTSGNLNQFVLPTDNLKEFIAFTGLSYLTPTLCGKVVNQNLHAITNKQMVIVAYPDFYDEAMQLANIHEKEDNISTVVVTPQQIYNEFSSGAQDATAIRSFVKMMYDRAVTPTDLPRYLLLFGDGSYDNKTNNINNTNFIVTHQSDQSTSITTSYTSDDYFGLLDDTEGEFLVGGGDAIDIGIGRFPVKTKAEAKVAVNKIITYMKKGIPPNVNNSACLNNNLSSFGDWRNMLCFVADDEDGVTHISQANTLADSMESLHKNYTVDKIYLDAYKQESTPGGQRYPTVNEAINQRLEKGCLVFNYTGHGGERGLAAEQVVTVPQINKWNNRNKLPLFFTATCEFSRYDNKDEVSAGEYVFLNPNGGAIALLTTVRLVYSQPNFELSQDFYKVAFTPVNGVMPRLGDLYVYIKIKNLSSNSRNFSLLGDPALRLAYPKFDVITDSVNNKVVTSASSDTLKALSIVTVSGHIENNGAKLTSYNGILQPTVYDKPQQINTLMNDPNSGAYTFDLQKNVLYKGKVSVTNGFFKFTFIVPKDIAYKYGIGKISYYAENGNEDANGYYNKVVIGGYNDAAITDKVGPEINLYMNDNKFVYGGTTNENADLFATVKDDNGVNTVGNGIGHDITAILDANTEKAVVLNDYYQADLNSYKSGTVRYPFKSLSKGSHTLNLKVWDVYNNSSESRTEFVVSESAELALTHVLNYPNPFTTRTQFYFEHNQCCQLLDVEIHIFTVSGKLVKKMSKYVHADGYRSDPIEWNGTDEYGEKIGKGVYIYRIKVKTAKGLTAEKYEKLVILR